MTTNSKPKIAIYTSFFLPISETFIYRQLLGVTEEFNPIVITKTLHNQDLFPYDKICLYKRNLKERIYSKIISKFSNNYSSISKQQVQCFKNILTNNQIQLIHAHFGPHGLNMLPPAQALNIPLVVTFHGYDASAELQVKKYAATIKKLFQYAYIIAVSNKMATKLISLGANPDRTFTHYIGAPLDTFKYQPRKPIVLKVKNNEPIKFLQIARFAEKKGHKYTLEAFKTFLTYYPKSELILAGTGPLENQCKEFCKQHHLENIRFIGPVTEKEVIPLLQQADVYLQHSITASNGDQEGIPIGIAEAMATGLPIISTLHSGIPELVRDGIDGHLVNEKDINGYVNKMRQILNFKEQDTQSWIKQKFDLEANCKTLSSIYRQIISSHK